ncbi:HTH-type transcriptional regulator CysL [Stieleria varia]|uniref:HTH-type transcriptional regulator CysL n=2 Tax=Stieleria varia TaxID=2528005 RepID=A0A5C6AXJ7_9BACT|nr:HTH-type transcriptional regulator CysL [Stieleria varia]
MSDLTQSGVSQAIQQLEESLGVILIDRSKRPLGLTGAGEVYYRGVRDLLGRYRRLEQEVVSTSKQLEGQVCVAAIYSVGLSYMPEATQAFKRLHPEVDLRLSFGRNERVMQMVVDGIVDIGLVSFPKNTKQVQSVLWQQEPIRLVCSPQHPFASRRDVSLSDLQGLEMVGFDRELELRQLIDQTLQRLGITVDVRMEFDNADSIVRAIQANQGIGILPEAVVRRETAVGSLQVVACPELRITRPLGIMFKRPGRLSRAANEFGSLLLGRPLEPDRRSKPIAAKAAAVDLKRESSAIA